MVNHICIPFAGLLFYAFVFWNKWSRWTSHNSISLRIT